MKKITVIIIIILIMGISWYLFTNHNSKNIKENGADPLNATYLIDNKPYPLKDGVAETTIPDSDSKIITRYFGNEVKTDLNDDGKEDIVFLLTQETGGSGTFFYVVAALDTDKGWQGSHALFLGDRIAPQTTELSRNPSHKNVIVINYSDKKPDENRSHV